MSPITRTRLRMKILILDADDSFAGYLRVAWTSSWPARMGAVPEVHHALTRVDFEDLAIDHRDADLALVNPGHGDASLRLIETMASISFGGPVIGYSDEPDTVAEMRNTDGFARVLARGELIKPELLVVGPLAGALASGVPSVSDAQRAGVVVHHRFVAQSRGPELYVLGLDEDRRSAWCAVISPGHECTKELIDLADLGQYADRGLDQIVWDPAFAPQEYVGARIEAGQHPVVGREFMD